MHQKRPFRTRRGDGGFNRGSADARKGDGGFNWGSAGARKGDDGFNPTQMPASKGDTGFRRAGRLVYRTQMRYPWPVAEPGRTTSGRPTLQTSSNQHDSNRLARTSVTNVVNLSPKTSIFSEKADGLTTFVTTRAEPHVSTPSAAGVEGAGGSGGPDCSARGRRPGPTAPGTPAEPQATTHGADGSRAGRRPPAHTAAGPSGARNTRGTTTQRNEAATGCPATASSRSRSAVHNSATSNQAVMST